MRKTELKWGIVTVTIVPTMDIELAPSRRKAVPCSGRRGRVAALGGREQSPGHVGGVERVKIIERRCRQRGRQKDRIRNQPVAAAPQASARAGHRVRMSEYGNSAD